MNWNEYFHNWANWNNIEFLFRYISRNCQLIYKWSSNYYVSRIYMDRQLKNIEYIWFQMFRTVDPNIGSNILNKKIKSAIILLPFVIGFSFHCPILIIISHFLLSVNVEIFIFTSIFRFFVYWLVKANFFRLDISIPPHSPNC